MSSVLNALLNGPAHYTQSHHLNNGMTLVVVFGALLAEFVCVYLIGLLIIRALQYHRAFIGLMLRHFGVVKPYTEKVFLELTFPADTSKSAFATEQFNTLMRSGTKYHNLKERLAAHKLLHSQEIYSTHDTGIRYVMVVPEAERDYIEHSLRSYLPGLKIKQVLDYLPAIVGSKRVGVIELRLSNDFVLPLKDHKTLEEHDPMAYLTGHMTKLIGKELIAYQIVYTPIGKRTHNRVSRHIRDMQHRIALGQIVSSHLVTQRNLRNRSFWILWDAPVWFLGAMLKIVRGVFQLLVAAFSKDHLAPDFLAPNKDKKPLDNPYELELGAAIKSKLDQPLFEVSIRVLVAADDEGEIDRRLSAFVASFQPFDSGRQGLIEHRGMSIFDKRIVQFELFKDRRLTPHFPDQQTVISASELADLYHFPETSLTKTDGLVKSRSPELPASLSLKRSNTKLDVVIGTNHFGGESTPLGLTLEQRQKHTYVIGKTGMGKTTLLTSSIYQDMVNGKGVAVLDAHGDMFRELLEIVPEHRKNDVIIFDPSDRQHPVGLNILSPGVTFEDNEDAHEWITSMVLSVFAKISDETFWGPRMEHVLRSVTLTALQQPQANLYTLQRLLTDRKYQKAVAKELDDPVLKQFWSKELANYGTMQLASLAAPLTHRLGHFITAKMSRHILLQEKSTIHISDIMNDGKILLVNLSKGDIGEDQSYFFGTLLSSLLWMAAYQRTKIPEKMRRDFFVYVDEFQNFASPQFVDITSEGRKFHIALTVSHQNIAQVKDASILKVVAGNAASIICLKASPDDEAFILPFMKPELKEGSIVNLAPYHFFMKTTTDDSEEAFSGITVPLTPQGACLPKVQVIAESRKRYTMPRSEVEAYLEELFEGL